MRNLIIFLWKNIYFFLFVALEILSFWLIVENSNYQRSAIVSSTNLVSGNIINTWGNITQYFNLKDKNDELALQNAKLLNQMPNSYMANSNSTFIKNDTIYNQQFSYTDAKVISNSINKQKNFLILNKGSNFGIQKEMSVISPTNGVIGFVKDVSANFCSVISLLNRDTKISSKIKRTGFSGTVLWDGLDYRYAKLIDIPYHLNVVVGDTVVTSGYSAIFPVGINIGTVLSVKPNKNDNFYSIVVKLETDFNKIDYVYIIKNQFKSELDSLQSKFKQ